MSGKEAYILLNLLPGIGPIRVKRLLNYFASPEDIFKEKSSLLSRFEGIGDKLANVIRNWQTHVCLEDELKKAEKANVTILTTDEQEYPPLLKEIYDPPLCLYVRGNVAALNTVFPLAIVGSRRTSSYGVSMTESITSSAVSVGITTISGLARGIDTVAHQTTVEHDGITIAVLGGGIGHIYPQENVGLAHRICEKGAVISEFPMQNRPNRKTFPMRNRIIAGLSRGVLVMEAGPHSGSLITAKHALDYGRVVCALPGRVDYPQSRGCHSLIKQGATLVETIDDILEEFPTLQRFHNPASSDTSEAEDLTLTIDITEYERKILVCLYQHEEMSVDAILQCSKLPVPRVLSSLLSLEIKRVVRQLPGKRFMLNKRKN